MSQYHTPRGGLPGQNELMTGRAIFTEAYAVIPAGTMRDITTSAFPFWEKARGWIIARPMTGFAETFSHYLMELEPDGGSLQPEPDMQAEGALFVTGGQITLMIESESHHLTAGGFAFIPPGMKWTIRNKTDALASFHWIRKAYEAVDGLGAPEPIIVHEREIEPVVMPDTDGRWSTTRFMDPADLRHDMHMTVVNFEPGGVIPFEETHVMEHGLFVLEGKAVYKLNADWVEVEQGDFMWLRAFCPQACYAGGSGRFRYLLYKDVNRHAKLKLKNL